VTTPSTSSIASPPVRDLTRAECLQRLGGSTFGRIAATSRALPIILPVNYRLVHDRIVFRTSPGTKLTLAVAGAVVAFETDAVDPIGHAGWSVLAIGRATVVTEPAEVEQLDAAGVPRWAEGGDERFISIATTELTGRQIGTPW
jgi:nitroimidazol reductase NimA-like FMN-containing flavoprotein (pyridoxamine 5'-phosphate oxidase superfamily)